MTVRNFRLYFIGQFVSATGTWMQAIAQMWLVLQITGSGVALGVTTALQFTPPRFEVTAGKWPVLQPFGDLITRRPPSLPKRPRDWAFWGLVRPFAVASQWLSTRPVR